MNPIRLRGKLIQAEIELPPLSREPRVGDIYLVPFKIVSSEGLAGGYWLGNTGEQAPTILHQKSFIVIFHTPESEEK